MTSNVLIPVVVEKSDNGSERSYDLPSRLMKDQIISIDEGVDENLAKVVGAQIMYLDSRKNKDILMYITSPGGSVHHGLKIADQMELARSDIRTICTGYAASMGCFLTTMGTPGKRLITRRGVLMAHQVSSGTKGLITDQKIALEHSEYLNNLLMSEMADRVGVSHAQLVKDCDRDYWLNPTEALNYGKFGFVDGILTGKRNADGKLEVLRRNGKVEYLGDE